MLLLGLQLLASLLVDARKRQEDNYELGPRPVPLTSTSISPSNTERRWWTHAPDDVLLFYATGLHCGLNLEAFI